MVEEQRFLYINTVDILDDKKIIGVGLMFNLIPTPRMINKDGTIFGDYYEFTHFRSGVMIDDELGEFWMSRLKKKQIRCFLRKKQFMKKKKLTM